VSDVGTARHNTLRDLAGYWLPPLAWMGIIFYLSAQPDLPGPPEPLLDALLKKGGHFVGYAMLAFLWWRALSRGRRIDRATLVLAFVVVTLYSVSDEFHQSFVPNRRPSPGDVLIDAAGAATALWLVWRRRGRS
jgi:VanZ family protein